MKSALMNCWKRRTAYDFLMSKEKYVLNKLRESCYTLILKINPQHKVYYSIQSCSVENKSATIIYLRKGPEEFNWIYNWFIKFNIDVRMG